MKYCLWLDDYRPLPTDTGKVWVMAKSMAEFKKTVIELGMPEYISFDHDLNEKHYALDYTDQLTGLDTIQWLINYVQEIKAKAPFWRVHTMNVYRHPVMFGALYEAWPNNFRPKLDYIDEN